MQVEQPHHPPRGFGDFIRQYAMIVLSILTALGLERGAVSLQNAALARASRARIEAEIASVRADLVTTKQNNDATVQALAGVMKSLMTLLASGAPNDAAVLELGKQAFPKISISIPDYPRDAWETAIADQSATHLDPADLARYSKIYTAERNDMNFASVLLQGNLVGQMTDAGIAVSMGKVDAQSLVHALAHYVRVLQIIDAEDAALIALIDQPVGK
jgi:hypothetical protein